MRRACDILDLRPAKRAALRLLPPGHPVREAIAHEPDVLPRAEGLARLKVYARVLLVTGPR